MSKAAAICQKGSKIEKTASMMINSRQYYKSIEKQEYRLVWNKAMTTTSEIMIRI